MACAGGCGPGCCGGEASDVVPAGNSGIAASAFGGYLVGAVMPLAKAAGAITPQVFRQGVVAADSFLMDGPTHVRSGASSIIPASVFEDFGPDVANPPIGGLYDCSGYCIGLHFPKAKLFYYPQGLGERQKARLIASQGEMMEEEARTKCREKAGRRRCDVAGCDCSADSDNYKWKSKDVKPGDFLAPWGFEGDDVEKKAEPLPGAPFSGGAQKMSTVLIWVNGFYCWGKCKESAGAGK